MIYNSLVGFNFNTIKNILLLGLVLMININCERELSDDATLSNFSKTGEILDLAVEFEVIKKAGSWFSYGETKLGQGRDGVKALIKDNPELADELEVKIKAIIKENNA